VRDTVTGKLLHFRCQLCICPFNDENAKEQHLRGRRHRLAYQKMIDPNFAVDVEMDLNQQNQLKQTSSIPITSFQPVISVLSGTQTVLVCPSDEVECESRISSPSHPPSVLTGSPGPSVLGSGAKRKQGGQTGRIGFVDRVILSSAVGSGQKSVGCEAAAGISKGSVGQLGGPTIRSTNADFMTTTNEVGL
ncbi:unnamed protein product, partial [Protopolystoma xenopodis]